MANGEIFNTVMRGYKKDEVLAYIGGLNQQLQETKELLDKSEAALDRLQTEKEIDSSAAMEQRESELRAEIESSVRAELEQQNQQKIEDAVQEKVADLAQKMEEYRAKAEEYDQRRADITEVMLEARRNADEVLAHAKADAQALRLTAAARFDELSAAFSVLRGQMEGGKTDLLQKLEQMKFLLNSFDDKMDQIEHTIETSKKEFTGDYSENI